MKTKPFATAFLITLLAGTGSLYAEEPPPAAQAPSANEDQPAAEVADTTPEWLVVREVVYIDDFGQAGMDFEGMDRLYLDSQTFFEVWGLHGEEDPTIKPALRYEQVQEWERGQKVEIRYSVQTGAVVYDPESGLYIGIKQGLVDHPLDELFTEKKGEGSTMSVLFASREVRELWKKEIGRLYDEMAERLDADGKADLEAARKVWDDHYNFHMILARQRLQTAMPGSGASYYFALESLRFIRHHGMTLARW